MKAKLAALFFLVTALQVGCGSGGGTTPNPPLQPFAITSNPPTAAAQGQAYAYSVTTNSAGQSPVTLQLVSGPVGAELEEGTLSWAPTVDQSRVEDDFTIKATSARGIATQVWAVTPSGPVQGTKITTFRSESGDVQVPDDTTQSQVTANIPTNNGGFSPRVATGTTTGDFSFPNMPGGNYWLNGAQQTNIWTPSSIVDLGSDQMGRPGTLLPTAPTQIEIQLNGLNPWQSSDFQQLLVANTGTLREYDWTNFGLAVGSTSVDQQVIWTDPLTSYSDGDSIYLTQLVTQQNPSGYTLQVLQKALGPYDFEQSDGTGLDLQGTLSDASISTPLRANIHGSAFAQLESGINPSAVADSTYFYLDVQPGGIANGVVGVTPDLIRFNGNNNPIRTDVDMGDISYGNPYPASWTEFLDYIHYIHVDYTAPGATASARQFGYIEVQSTTLPTANSAVSPAVGPVSTPKINGKSFFNSQSSAGTTPTLSWSLPSLGTPTGYMVEVFLLYANGTDSLIEPAGTLYTRSTSIQLPPGMLTVGTSYFFRLSAVLEPGVNYESAPFRHAFPRSVAQVLSGTVIP